MAKGQQQDQSGMAQSGYNKPARPEWGQASWYQQHIPSQLAQGQANQLGISTDQMYQIYAQQGLGPSAIGSGGGGWSNPNQGGGAGTGGQWIPSTPGVISDVQQAEQAHSIGNILWPQQVQQTLGPPPPAPSGQTGTVMNPLQLPVQRYQSGGMVQSNQAGQSSDPNPPYYDPNTGTYYQSPSYGRGSPLSTTYAQNNALYGTNQQGLLTGNPVQYANASSLANVLGAAALNSPIVLNQTPSGTPSSRSGVAPVGNALIGGGVPSVPQGPWLTNPSVFARATPNQPTAAPTVTPQTPATAVPYAPGQAFATPAATPGYTLGSALPPTMAQSGATTTSPPTAMLPPGFVGGAQGAGYVPQGWQQPPSGAPPAPVSAPVALQAGAAPQAFLQAHTSALQNAGMALYSHFGGDPNKASLEDIANFQNQLTDAVGQHIAGAGPGAGHLLGSTPSGPIPPPNPTAGTGLPANLPGISGGLPAFGTAPVTPSAVAPTGAAAGPGVGHLLGTTPSGPIPSPNLVAAPGLLANLPGISGGPPVFGTAPVTPSPVAPPKRAATGGLVPGRGNEDSVPALLTPGEYVIPKDQVAQLAARGVLRLNSGGPVQDPDPDPPEARRQALTVQAGNAPAASQPANQPSSATAQSSSPQIGGGSNLFSGLSQAAHTYGNSLASIGTNAYQAPAGSSAMTVGQLGSGPIPGGGQTMSLGKLPAGGGGLSSALGGIGSGLTQAAQAIASSVKPWQMQQSAIPDPSQLPKYQIPTLQAQRVA